MKIKKNMQVFTCSDHHFGQETFYKYSKRHNIILRPEFPDADTADREMVERHNSIVPRTGSVVFYLGDLAYNSSSLHWIEKMNGEWKILVGGNHDYKFPLARLCGLFDKVAGVIHLRSKNVILTHVPIHPDELRGAYNVHGHVHRNPIDDPKYINSCMELNDYYPIPLRDMTEE